MNEKILDFNSDRLKFKVNDVTKYNINTIYNNIEKFQTFMTETANNHAFSKIFNSTLFQVALSNETTNYFDTLLDMYNSIASGKLADGIIAPMIDKKEFKRQLKIKGYEVYRRHQCVSPGIYEYVYKVRKKDTLIWESEEPNAY